MPMPQRKLRNECERAIDKESAEGDQHKRRKHARNVQSITRFGDAEGKAAALAGGAGRQLRDNGADEREPAADA